jgi:hypothetical protein
VLSKFDHEIFPVKAESPPTEEAKIFDTKTSTEEGVLNSSTITE